MQGHRRARRVTMLAVAAVLPTLLGALPAPAQAELLSRCTKHANDRTLCGRVTVPLIRSGALPGTISLRVRALPPARGRTATETILALAGGPGQAASPLLDSFASVLAPALRSRQVVTFDQRGTGGSGRISCPSLEASGDASSAVGRCAADLGPARVAYTTAESVADAEAVRAALGIERIVLYGTSYGAKVALGYAAAYPQHVERLILDSVVMPEGVDPFQRTTVASIPRVLRTLCVRGCSFTRDPVADVARLVRQLAKAPLRGTVIDGEGKPRHASLTRAGLLGLLLAGDFDRRLRAGFPGAVRAALDDDPAPLLRLTAGDSLDGFSSTDSDAVFVATTCEDGGVPWPAGTPLDQRRAAANAVAAALPERIFAPLDRETVRAVGSVDLCRAWPESPIAQPAPALPGTPTLILSGDDDLRTPRADAIALANRLPGAQLLQVPDAGHGALFSDPTDCAQVAVVAFLDGKVPGRCRRRSRAVPTSDLPPQDLAAVAPIGGLPATSGRVVRAIVDTLDDAEEQVVAAVTADPETAHGFGGLRAGSASIDTRGLRLRRYVYVRGVSLSGLIGPKVRRFTLRIGGAKAVRGHVTVSATGIVGRLGGRDVDVSAKRLRRATATAAIASASAMRTTPVGPQPALWLPSWTRR